MPLVSLDTLPDDARTWVFAATPALTPEVSRKLVAAVDDYLVGWQAHGAPLTVGRTVRESHFLVIAVDQRSANASGCSIDGLFRVLRELESQLELQLVSGGRVFWRTANGAATGGPRDRFVAAAERGEITADTLVFDTTVGTLGALRTSFEKRAGDSWHAQLLPRATASV